MSVGVQESLEYVIKTEYYLDIQKFNEASVQKRKRGNQSSIPNTELDFHFSDIHVWFFKKNCAESVTEAKQIWDTIQQNELKRVDLNTFSKGYASEILLAQKNYKSLLDKSTKLLHTQQKLMAYIDSLDKLFDADFEQILRLEQSRKAHPQPFFNAHDGVQFSFTLRSLFDFDMDASFAKKNFAGYQIAIAYQDNVVESPVVELDGDRVAFDDFQLSIQFSYQIGTVSIQLYEVTVETISSEKEVPKRTCVAQRNIDPFACLKEEYLRMLQEPVINQLNFDDEDQTNHFQTFELGYINSLSAPSSPAKQAPGSSNSFETLQSDSSTDLQLMQMAQLNMRVEVKNLTNQEDVLEYYLLLLSRVQYIKDRYDSASRKCAYYQQKLSTLIAPFSLIKYDDETISFETIIKEKSTHDQDQRSTNCSIF